jgi:hypothetical protein
MPAQTSLIHTFPLLRTSVNFNTSAVGVAQLVERRTVAPNVAGSNPVSHPILWLSIPHKKDLYLVSLENVIGRHQHELLNNSLRDQETIERVLVVRGQVF